jgi:AAA+ ATPase superfamily predicted ATPase
MNKLIGRYKELEELKRCCGSDQSEFVIVYGRRRIGKTFLVRQFTGDKYAFSYVGVRDISQRQQLDNFALSLQQYGKTAFAPALTNWMDAFLQLRKLLERRSGRKIVFIDEMPWMDKSKSDFISALENFWNGWAAAQGDICFIACGSATSWMTDKLIYNTAGLHNRITSHIYLRPFTLAETEEYLEALGCHWDRFQIAQCYMAMGGVPYYLSLIHPRESLMQNIDRLYFHKNAELREEFFELYHSLFKNAIRYIDVVKTLATKRQGMTRQEISKHLNITGSGLTHILSQLERCDFILGYSSFGNQKNNVIYRLTDFYTLFYLQFVSQNRSQDENWWEHNMNSPQVRAWQGFSFELLCMLHLQQIKRSLSIGGIATTTSSWRSRNSEHHYQIDMVIDRSDRIINLCEMKFSINRYMIDKDYEMLLRDRMAWFVAETKTRKTPVITMITTYGVMPNKHAGIVQSEVTLDGLFS